MAATAAVPDAQAATLKLMEAFSRSWSDRVAVRKERLDLTQYYDKSIPDFPIEIIPFARDPEFTGVVEQAGTEARLRYLAATWIAYNERVIFVEDDLVQPLCGLLRKHALPGVLDARVQEVVAQVQVDEQFHTLMCLEVCNSARERHQLHGYVLPEPLLARRMKARLAAHGTPHDHALIRMAYAAISEATIHEYLRLLSSNETIQPVNRMHTEMHRRDESAHGPVFIELTRSVFRGLDAGAQGRFLVFFTDALRDSTEIDIGFWASTLPYLQQRDWNPFVDRITQELSGKRIRRDYGVLVPLLDDLGIRDKIEFSFS
ncbi:diiron oxygenase [Ramlibacter sp.]|uniref:diiron oxygenase n=1 Tax=Ramlibacter sp. TaxID=1917967 RepID=UPI0017AA7731|nr:diiron oxygenase [Ramlibacter sp.]MBA2674979.1 diiron oxygenase [Ramlibacter sp.]